MHLSFVLLPTSARADAPAIAAAYARMFPGAPPVTTPAPGSSADGDVVELCRADAGAAFVASMEAAIPNREADEALRFNVGSLTRQPPVLPPHGAHFIVTSLVPDGGASSASLALHTRLVAAIVDAHRAIGVYEGTARATHAAAFYVDVATTMELPVMLWTGVSVAWPDTRTTELLSLGLEQLGIPNFLIAAPNGRANEALPFLFDLVAYVLDRGAAIADGETVGRSAQEKLTVRYVASPIDPGGRVARIELR